MESQGYEMHHYSAEDFEVMLRMEQQQYTVAPTPSSLTVVPKERPTNFSFRIHAPAGAGKTRG